MSNSTVTEIAIKCGCYDATEATATFFPRDKLDWRSETCEFLRDVMEYHFPRPMRPEGGKCFCPICRRIICDGCIYMVKNYGIEEVFDSKYDPKTRI